MERLYKKLGNLLLMAMEGRRIVYSNIKNYSTTTKTTERLSKVIRYRLAEATNQAHLTEFRSKMFSGGEEILLTDCFSHKIYRYRSAIVHLSVSC